MYVLDASITMMNCDLKIWLNGNKYQTSPVHTCKFRMNEIFNGLRFVLLTMGVHMRCVAYNGT